MCAPLNSDDRNFFGEPCLSAMMVLCRIRYYFITVMGLGITILEHKVCQLPLLVFWPLPGLAMRIDAELTPIR